MVSLKEKLNGIRKQNRDNVALGMTFCATSLLLIGCAIASPKLGKNMRLVYLALAGVTSAVQIIHAESSKKIAGLSRALDEYEKKGLSAEIAIAQNLDASIDKIKANQDLLNVIEYLEEHQQPRYIQQFGLTGLERPRTSLSGEISNSQSPSPVVQVRKALPVFDDKIAKIINTEWMNHNFFFSGGAVLGAKGQGKSEFIKLMIANILAIAPDTDLKVHDLHYSVDEPKFPNLPLDVEQSLFITTPQDCLNDMRNVMTELRRREVENDKTSSPIIRIVDEENGMVFELGDDADEYLKICHQILNRGRKYGRKINGKDTGVNVIIGLHSAKKEHCLVDSNFFAVGFYVILGMAIADPNTKFPLDFNQKQLVKDIQACNAQLTELGLKSPTESEKDKARAIVVRLSEQSPEVKVMPRPDLSKLQFSVLDDSTANASSPEHRQSVKEVNHRAINFRGDTWMEKLTAWYRAIAGECTDEQLITQVHELTGKMIDANVVGEIRRVLGGKQ